MLYVYAVTEAGAFPSEPGIGGAPTHSVLEAGLAVIVSDIEASAPKLDEDDMWTHESVVESVMGTSPVLPMRLGTILPAEDDVRALVRERRDELAEALERVRGAVELGLRAAIASPARPALATAGAPEERAMSGSEYMRERLDAKQRADELARRIHEPLASVARESSYSMRGADGSQMRASYLVDDDAVEEFQRCVEALERDDIVSTITCTGPWPPYSFVALRSPT